LVSIEPLQIYEREKLASPNYIRTIPSFLTRRLSSSVIRAKPATRNLSNSATSQLSRNNLPTPHQTTSIPATALPQINYSRSLHITAPNKMVSSVTSMTEFKKFISEDKVTVVDFFATWCGPCKQIAPFVEKLSKEFDKNNFLKVDVDEVSDVAAEVGVRAMPTFMVFRNGEKVAEVVGANPAALKAAVKKANED